MANASKKHFGVGTRGKSSGEGAMTTMPQGMLEENAVLSNRDKAEHSKARGMDGKQVKTEQRQDHAANRIPADEQLGERRIER